MAEGFVNVLPAERLDRQLRITGWNQRALDQATVGVVGDDDLLASLFLLSAAALGINNLRMVAPKLDPALAAMARKINPELRLGFLEGYFSHPLMGHLFSGCQVLVDLTSYGLANKQALERGLRENLPVIRGFCFEAEGEVGFRTFTYLKGKEWQELAHLVAPHNFPAEHFDDGVFDIIVAGLVLEETKNLLMGWGTSEELFTFQRPKIPIVSKDLNILVVGAGALGNFVGLGLAFSGFKNITFMDADLVEPTNLNRQIFFSEAIGQSKAEALAARLNLTHGTQAQAIVGYFQEDTDASPYDVVFDCVDNFETRIILSEKCRAYGKILLSGGSGLDAGQVVAYDPRLSDSTPAELLGLNEIVDRRGLDSFQRTREACVYQPDPSVIMTNQIIGGLMVESCRLLLAGAQAKNFFYGAGTIMA